MTTVPAEPMLLDQLAPRYQLVSRDHLVVDALPDQVFAAAEHHVLNDTLLSEGWEQRDVRPGQEIVYRGVARFWTPLRHRHRISAEGWSAIWEPHLCDVTTSISVRPYGSEHSLLSCETRLKLEDADTLRGFLVYWRALRPVVRALTRWTLRDLGAAAGLA